MHPTEVILRRFSDAMLEQALTGDVTPLLELQEELRRPAEDLTPEGIQLVIPGAERHKAASTLKQGELF